MMKLGKIFRLTINSIAALLTVAAMTSCGEDRWPEYAALTVKDQWIYDTMQENYLWSEEMPSSDGLNMFSVPATFLKSVIYSTEDNSYSSVDTISAGDATYGFTYSLQRNMENDTAYYALVTRVIPDSPAYDAGIERGDWIMTVDGEVITNSNASTILAGSSAMKLTLGKYKTTTNEDGETEGSVVESGTANVSSARIVDEDAVEIYTVVTSPKGTRVGYLVYNSFEAGDNDIYANELRKASNYFAQQGVNHLIVDLRYNSGGTFTDSQLLASIIAPAATVSAGDTYAQLTYGTKRSADNRSLTYSNSVIGSGSNLNIGYGVVITGSNTSASVAGCFLNCISTLQRWALVGSSLKCWGVATEDIVSDELQWVLKPVVCYVANSSGETGAGGSFTPNVSASESSDYSRYLPLGNSEEYLLHTALQLIDE